MMKPIYTFILLLILPYLATAQDRQADSLILVDIFNSLDGPNWTNPLNWLSDRPLEEWRGVQVQNDRVIGLAFTNQKPKGAFPSQILGLDQLVNLEFRGGAEVTGGIPADLVQLTELARFSVSSCELSGEVPNIFTQFPNLQSLILRDNNFEGPLPDIPNGLSLFYAQKNNFSGPIPASWSDRDIGTLDISENNLTGSFEIFQTWPSIRQLYLSDNDWAPSLFPKWLGDNHSFVRFRCSNCNLTGELPSDLDLSNLDSYSQMILDDNDLSGDVSLLFSGPEAFNALDLSINGNNFEGEFPAHLIRKPKTIDIRNNNYTSLSPFADSVSFNSFQITNNKLNYESLEPVKKYIELDSIIGVEYSEMQMTMTPETITVTEPTTITLQAGDLDPSTTYEWIGPNVNGETNAELILNIDEGDPGGEYYCQMSNEKFPELLLERHRVLIVNDLFTSTKKEEKLIVNITPNPTSGLIHVSVDEAIYKIVTLHGQVLKEGNVNGSQQIDISALSSGTYVLQLIADGKTDTQKIIKL